MDDTHRQWFVHHLFHESGDALFLFEPEDRRVLDANASACRLTGFDATALRAMTLEALFAGSGPDGLPGLPDRCLSGASRGLRPGYWLRRRRGRPISVSVNISAIDSKDRVLGLAIMRDADARPAEFEVLARFFALSPELFGVGTCDGRILKVNSAWQRALGYTAEDLVGRSIGELIAPSAFDTPAAAAPASVRGGISDFELRMRHKDGSDRWIGWSVVLVAGRVFAIGRDVTEQRRFKAALRRAEEAAAAAHRAKGEFLAGMSHEIRTPMTAILGFADLLAERWRGSDAPAEDREALQTIKRNGDLLLGLINDILDLAKIEADRAEVTRAPCSPAQLVADVMGLMHVRAEARGLTLDAEFVSPIPATIATDAIRLRQILINLIGNAIKFTDRGGVRLRVRPTRVEDGAPVPSLQFEVVDTGIGIRDEEIDRLFQPFYRADASPTRRHGGTGLGLALSMRLAERLGGTIGARSLREGGSAFTLTIPILATPSGGAIAEAAGQGPAPGPAAIPVAAQPVVSDVPAVAPTLACRVLLAEDNRDTQRVISLRLGAAGAAVTPAPNGQVAVDLALEAQRAGRPFDVILMDMQMPVLDGYEATRTLRGAGYPYPIIAVTAHAMTEDREECLRFGCDDYLAKPIDWGRLTALVVSYARRRYVTTH